MQSLINLLHTVLSLYSMVLFVWVILSVLIQFDIVNRWHPIVSRVWDVLERLTEPLLRPIRRYVPLIGGFDLSPIVLILLVRFLQDLLMEYGNVFV